MIPVYVNFAAVLVAAIANMALGFLWYGPVFGKYWMSLMNLTAQQIEAGKQKMKGQMWQTYGLQFLGSVLTAYVLSHFIAFTSAYFLDIGGVSMGVTAGFWAWLGFVIPVTLTSVLWEGKSWKLWFLNISYYLLSLLVMGSIVSAWI